MLHLYFFLTLNRWVFELLLQIHNYKIWNSQFTMLLITPNSLHTPSLSLFLIFPRPQHFLNVLGAAWSIDRRQFALLVAVGLRTVPQLGLTVVNTRWVLILRLWEGDILLIRLLSGSSWIRSLLVFRIWLGIFIIVFLSVGVVVRVIMVFVWVGVVLTVKGLNWFG